MKVVLDSNALLLPFEPGIDIFRGIEKLVDGRPEYVVFRQSVNELKSKSRKERLRVEAVVKALEKNGAEMLEKEGGGKVDEMIIDYAAKHKGSVAVCTEDRELKKKLKEIGGVQLIFSKGGSHMATDWQRND